MPIFQDANGLAVKFFLQKDIPQEIQADLCETITSLGGRVEVKVPRQGFILVQPGTPEAERLRQCWIIQDRPERYLVPYTYIEACKIAGIQLKQIFMENGRPTSMHIHPSIANLNARSALASRILHSGGDPDASIQDAHVILADPNTEVFHHLIKTYQNTPGKHIESYLWVKKCIERGSLIYTPVVFKNPGGRRPGEERTQFTVEDEEHLCQWIAQKIPYKETGGRTGNRLYQQLCEQSDPEYNWVSRHTWQSWRERYKKNSARLDGMIARVVEEKRPAQGQQGQYGYVRQPESKPKRPRKKRGAKEDGNEEEAPHSIDELAQLPAMPMPTIHPVQPMMGTALPPSTLPEFHGVSAATQRLPQTCPTILSPHASLPMPSATAPAKQSPAEEEMEDNEESEWVVRVGNAPLPAWAKRKVDNEAEDIKTNKRQKSGEGAAPDEAPYAATLQSPPLQQSQTLSTSMTLATEGGEHIIDQSVRAIAKECRFTLEEVQEYYDKCGDMGHTRRRFQKMRELLTEKFANYDD